jgi:8-oxo-dGTP pyrophosphatase MutT (NUDIX family)
MMKRRGTTACPVYKKRRIEEEPTKLPLQTGALPYRLGRKKRVEVLLVTGRRSRRWTIPKGWPMPGKSLAEAAAQEAFEEAGVRGKVDPEPIGSFRHIKSNLAIGDLEVSILVHSLSVERELPKWPEIGQRKRKWFSAKDAAERVDSDELRTLIMESAERVAVG